MDRAVVRKDNSNGRPHHNWTVILRGEMAQKIAQRLGLDWSQRTGLTRRRALDLASLVSRRLKRQRKGNGKNH